LKVQLDKVAIKIKIREKIYQWKILLGSYMIEEQKFIKIKRNRGIITLKRRNFDVKRLIKGIITK